MNKKIILTFLFLLTAFSFYPQELNYELELVGRVWFPGVYHGGNDTTGTSDCWGYTAPDGTEYAIIGVLEGIAFVRIPDLTPVDVIPGPTNNDYYYHRDIKTYKNYAYAVAEMTGENQGLMIMDLQYLPDSVHFVKSYEYPNNARSHNFSIDTARGFAYICTQNYSGFRVVDLNDPENPVDTNFVSTGNIHDVYARNDTVYVAEGYNSSYSIYDLSDKSNPLLLKRWSTPTGGYAHNVWASDDGKFVMTTEETKFRTVKYWDISDLDNIQIRGEYLADNYIAHNTHIKGNFAYISHYRAGVRVVDLSNPDSLKEVAAYSTYGGAATGNFYGNWGAYPFTNDGYIYGSDLEGWLTVVKLIKSPTGIDDDNILPGTISLKQNYPNPFNPSTTISYSISEISFIRLKIYNSIGEEIVSLVNEVKDAGEHTINFNAANLSSGVYYYRLLAGNLSAGSEGIYTETRQMILLK